MSEILGREVEVRRLNTAKNSRKSEFIAVYGRRRVGKTFLIREYFRNQMDFELTGLANASTRQQLVNFQATFQQQAAHTTPLPTPKNWIEAFQQLKTYLGGIKGQDKGKKVVFFDELPWLDTARSDFIMALEHFWNSWASRRRDIILITCGSAASWMINKLINNHGGLHNRVTERIKMAPFNLRETEQMLRAKNIVLDRYQIIQLYMAMGGIPFYLDAIRPGLSAWQIIEELCFRKGALLASEFQHLFASLFKKPAKHELIVTTLATKTKGLTRKELIKATGLSSGGGLTRTLRELEESGFITSYTPFNRLSRDTLYRVSDFYSLFYLRFIKNNRNYDPGVWVNAIDDSSHRAWSGYSFEQVCLAHIQQIKKALGISGIVSHASSWKSPNPENPAQVDLLIDRRDKVINLCEIKYSIAPYRIDKSYAEILRTRINAFRTETRTRKGIFLTMITTYGLQMNQYSNSLVQSSVTMDALFE